MYLRTGPPYGRGMLVKSRLIAITGAEYEGFM